MGSGLLVSDAEPRLSFLEREHLHRTAFGAVQVWRE